MWAPPAGRVTWTMAAATTCLLPPLLLLLLLLLTDTQLRPVECSRLSFNSSGLGPGSGFTAREGKAEPFFCKGPERRRVPYDQVCDGIADCGGREDETDCLRCQPGGWKCVTDPECISVLNKCDGVANCPDKSDEDRRRCLVEKCEGRDHFKCANGVCVHHEERCDCHRVCSDGSDEWNCPIPRGRCRTDEFNCTLSAGVCLRRCHVCDGHMDCHHGEDEKLCETCQNGAFHCHSDVCIEHFRRCNGVEDCDGGEDELGCPVGAAFPAAQPGSGRLPRHQEPAGRAAAGPPRQLGGAGVTPLLLLLLLLLC